MSNNNYKGNSIIKKLKNIFTKQEKRIKGMKLRMTKIS